MANERESKRWNDGQWAAAWPKRERLTEGLTPHLLATLHVAAGSGARVCDVGCGGGALTVALGGVVGSSGQVVGIDISTPLVQLARERARQAGAANVSFVVGDVQTDGLGPEPFDLVVSQLGVMFFDEPTAAFTAIRAGLRPGGRLVFACWQGVEQNPWHTGTALRAFVPPPRPPAPGKSPVGPFVLGDDEYVRDILGGAGFSGVQSSALEITVRAPASGVVDRSLLGFMGVAPERLGEADAALDAHLARFAVAGGDEYEYPLAFRVYEAAPLLMAGYSGTPLPKKLGIVEGSTLALVGAPDRVVDGLPPGVTVKRQARGKADVVVSFFTERRDFERRIDALGHMIFPDGGLWVAWPKRSSSKSTTMDENVVRAVVLPLGLVDNKVCAIDEVWTGLRVVWRRERR